MTAKDRHLSGKTAWVTGSSRGIGRSILSQFAKAGANVVLHGTHPQSPRSFNEGESLEAVAKSTSEAYGVDCLPVALNSGLYWPRRKPARHPGTIVVEILPAIAPGLAKRDFLKRLENDIEQASNRLIAEAASSEMPPPLPKTARE